jgi:hypothetical protein
MNHTESKSETDGANAFDWPLAFAAEEFLRQAIARFLARNRFAQTLAARMRLETGTDFFEWIDYLTLPEKDAAALQELGFEADKVETPHGAIVLKHPRATLPRVVLTGPEADALVALRPENLADFVAAHSLMGHLEGSPFARLRRVVASDENGTRLEAIERNGYRGFVSAPLHFADLKSIMEARELWRIRRRHCGTDGEGFAAARETLAQVINLVGEDLACQFFFDEERRYWESRNHAAQIQKRRQDQLGLGWGNHDHHTFRCSREHFVDVVEFFARLGFTKRERYYTGAEAGWGAQIMEQPTVGIVVFADVDLMPEETDVDFSSVRLKPAKKLGTVGLWVGLHGESFLEAGMHHLEARFEFEALREQLEKQGVRMMEPFSDFQFLRQAFSEGERWPVPSHRLDHLRRAELVTPDQSEKFAREGALGSHLENLQRRGGFKGFNQKSVSVIINATDPRKNLQAA